LFSVPSFAQQRGPSTPDERARAIQVANRHAEDPLTKENRKEREWLLRWLIEVPDITVHLCTSILGPSALDDFKYSGELIAQVTFSQAAFVIQNPDKASDREAEYRAGLEGALKIYESILKLKPKARNAKLDELLGKRDRGELAAHLKEAMAGCK